MANGDELKYVVCFCVISSDLLYLLRLTQTEQVLDNAQFTVQPCLVRFASVGFCVLFPPYVTLATTERIIAGNYFIHL